jgi:hypothetical protein
MLNTLQVGSLAINPWWDTDITAFLTIQQPRLSFQYLTISVFLLKIL